MSREHATFVADSGSTVTVSKADFDRVFLITTTLEPLDVYTAALHRVADLGIFSEGQLPWAVHLLDLRIVADLLEFPAQFVHYLDRRLRLHSAKNVEAGDEMDWLGHYLSEGLSLEDLQRWPADRIQLASYTTAMDDYFLYQAGQRKTPAPKPVQNMPREFRRVIEELEAERAHGYLNLVCELLDMAPDKRKSFAKFASKARKKLRREGNDGAFGTYGTVTGLLDALGEIQSC